MAITINVNNLTLCHKASGGKSKATLPDFCFTPASPTTPVSFPNFAFSKDLVKGTTTIHADGGNMCANYGSEFFKSTGDEQGTLGGVISRTFIKEATWITFSFDVKYESKGACRLTDKMFHNHMNTVNTSGLQQKDLGTGPLDCAAAWADAEKSTNAVLSEKDPIKRNKKISAAYAKAYKDQPHLKWFGAAAFASKQVGCGMEHARDSQDDMMVKGMGKDKLAEKSLEKLGDGNKAVFEEMYPAYEFYKKHGIEGLKQCASSRTPAPLPDKVVKGFEMADKGKELGDDAMINKGAETMLYQEQFVTLQKSAYDDPVFRQALKENQEWHESKWPTFGYSKPTKVVFDAACEAPAPSFEKAGGNLGDPKWRWDYAKGTTEKFSDLANKNPTLVDNELIQIIKDGK